jgi:hypothetical protein
MLWSKHDRRNKSSVCWRFVALPNFIKHRNSACVKSWIQNLRILDGAKAQRTLDAGKSTASIPTRGGLIRERESGPRQ